MSSDPSQDWQRLGEMLIRKRLDLDPRYRNRQIFAAERGVEYRIVSDIERARRTNFHAVTIAEIERAYGLASGAIARFLAGGELESQAPALPVFAPPPRGRKLKALQDSDEPGLVPYLAEVAAEVSRAMDEHGPDLTGAQAFPDRPMDQVYWDNPRLSGYERVRLVARMRRFSAEGGSGQRDRRVSGLTACRLVSR